MDEVPTANGDKMLCRVKLVDVAYPPEDIVGAVTVKLVEVNSSASATEKMPPAENITSANTKNATKRPFDMLIQYTAQTKTIVEQYRYILRVHVARETRPLGFVA